MSVPNREPAGARRRDFASPARNSRRLCALILASRLAAPLPASADGELDPTFGGGDGLVTRQAAGPLAIGALAVSDSRIFVVGRYSPVGGSPHLHWWAADPAGAIDSVHGCEGSTDVVLGATGFATSRGDAALVDAAGRLVVGGRAARSATPTQDRALIARFDPSLPGCALDTSFGTDGWEMLDDESFCSTFDCAVLDLVELRPSTGSGLPEPRLVALVRAASGGLGASRLFLLALLDSGAPDPLFGTAGWVEIDHAELGSTLFPEADLAADGRGNLYVLVTHSDPAEALDLDVSLISWDSEGSLRQLTFGRATIAVAGFGADGFDSRAGRLAVAADSSLFATFTSPGYISPSQLFARRALDVQQSVTNFTGAADAVPIAWQTDRRLVATWDSTLAGPDGFNAWRIRFDATNWFSLDPDFGAAGVATYDLDLGGDDAESVRDLVVWNGRPVYAGEISMPAGPGAFLARTVNLHVFSDSFESGTPAVWSAATGFSSGP